MFNAIRQTPFTLKEAAEYLEVAEVTVRRWANSGKVPVQKIGRNLLFDPDQLKQVKETLRASIS